MCHFYKDRAACDENCAVLRHFCAEVITYKKKVLYSEELRIIEYIKQVFQTKPKRETFCFCACLNFGQFLASILHLNQKVAKCTTCKGLFGN